MNIINFSFSRRLSESATRRKNSLTIYSVRVWERILIETSAGEGNYGVFVRKLLAFSVPHRPSIKATFGRRIFFLNIWIFHIFKDTQFPLNSRRAHQIDSADLTCHRVTVTGRLWLANLSAVWRKFPEKCENFSSIRARFILTNYQIFHGYL